MLHSAADEDIVRFQITVRQPIAVQESYSVHQRFGYSATLPWRSGGGIFGESDTIDVVHEDRKSVV